MQIYNRLRDSLKDTITFWNQDLRDNDVLELCYR